MNQHVSADLEKIAQVLLAHQVKFIVIGGWAGILHGLARNTLDVDVVYSRDRENIRRMAEALKPYSPYLRGAPPGLPFQWDERTIRGGLNFTLVTTLGDLDFLGEVSGGVMYEQLLPYSKEIEAFNLRFRIVELEKLIQLKRAAGRPKDLEVLAELQALLEERRKLESGNQ
jgi:predicted nucleotidyltransferase